MLLCPVCYSFFSFPFFSGVHVFDSVKFLINFKVLLSNYVLEEIASNSCECLLSLVFTFPEYCVLFTERTKDRHMEQK